MRRLLLIIFLIVSYTLTLADQPQATAQTYPRITPENVHNLVKIATLGSDSGVNAQAAWSADSNMLAVAILGGLRVYTVGNWDEPVFSIDSGEVYMSDEVYNSFSDDLYYGWYFGFTSNGKYLVTVHPEETVIRLWDVQTWQEVRTFEGHTAPIMNLAISPDSNWIASSADAPDGTARLWEIETGEMTIVATVEDRHIPYFRDLHFSQNSQLLVAGSQVEDAIVYLWNIQQKQAVEIQSIDFFGVETLAISSDANLLAISGWQVPGLSFWDTQTRELKGKITGGEELWRFWNPSRIRFNSDASQIVLAFYGDTIEGWDVPNQTRQWVVPYAGEYGLQFTQDERMLITVGDRLRFLDPQDGSEIFTLSDPNPIAGATLSPDETLLASITKYGIVDIWVVGTPTLPSIFTPQSTHALAPITTENASQVELLAMWGKGYAYQIAWQGDTFAVASATGIWLYDSRDWNAEPHSLAYGIGMYDLAFSPDGSLLAGAGADGLIYLWETENYSLRGVLRGSGSYISHLEFAPDGSTLISGSTAPDGSIRIWDVATLHELYDIPGIYGSYYGIGALSISPDGKTFVFSSGTFLNVWNLETRQELGVAFSGHDTYFNANFAPDGRLFIGLPSGSLSVVADLSKIPISDSTEEVILSGQASDYERVLTIDNSRSLNGNLSRAIFSHDGNLAAFVVGFGDEAHQGDVVIVEMDTIVISEIGALEPLMRIEADQFTGSKIVFSPNDQQIASLSSDGINIWDLEQQAKVVTLNDYISPTLSYLVMRPDGQYLSAYGSYPDVSRVMIWNLETGERSDIPLRSGQTSERISFNQDGTLIAAEIGYPPIIKIWDTQTRTLAGVRTGNLAAAWNSLDDVIFQGDKLTEYIFGFNRYVGFDYKSFSVFDGQTREELFTQDAEFSYHVEPTLSTDGSLVAVANFIPYAGREPYTSKSVISIWSVDDGDLLYQFDGYASPLAFSSDNSLLVSRSIHLGPVDEGGQAIVDSNEIKLIDLETGATLQSLHDNQPNSFIFTPDGSLLLTGGSDGVIRVWGVPNN